MPSWNPAYLEVRLSGGANNTATLNSLGGVMNSLANGASGRVVGYNHGALSNVTGVTVIDAPGSYTGPGTLAWNLAGQYLAWTAYQGTLLQSATVSGDGRYTMRTRNGDNSEGLLTVEVVAASLPGVNATDGLSVAPASRSMLEDISKLEAYTGFTDYHCFYVVNAHPTDALIDCKLYIGYNTTGPDNLQIGLGTSAIGDGATSPEQTVANKYTAPVGVTFVQPGSLGSALTIGVLGPGQAKAFWVQRTCPPTLETTQSNQARFMLYAVY